MRSDFTLRLTRGSKLLYQPAITKEAHKVRGEAMVPAPAGYYTTGSAYRRVRANKEGVLDEFQDDYGVPPPFVLWRPTSLSPSPRVYYQGQGLANPARLAGHVGRSGKKLSKMSGSTKQMIESEL